MSPSVWILPVIAFLSGLISLQIDPQKEPRKKWILIAMLILSAVGTVLITSHDNGKAEDDENYLRDRLKDLTGQSQHISQTADNVLQLLETSGVSANTIRVVQQAQAADASRRAILTQTQTSNQQRQAIVWYFPKDVDGPRVVAALQQGGFSVVEKSSNPHNESLPSNAIWVGDDVNLDQTRFVALTLIRAGVEIKSIRRLKDGSGVKASVVEVGSDGALQKAAPMTAEEVSNLPSLPARQ